jgi:hypothetical protein
MLSSFKLIKMEIAVINTGCSRFSCLSQLMNASKLAAVYKRSRKR